MKIARPLPPLASSERQALFQTLETRFDKHRARHPGLDWAAVRARLEAAPEAALRALAEMERTGGEPDVVRREPGTGAVVFVDCSPESPKGRVSLCYDRKGLDSRKEHKPAGDALGLAAAMGVELLDEAEYRGLQQLGEFDLKTSSWVKTPPEVRALGGALFGDRRYGRVFIYHNGAQSYYGARGFRAALTV